MISEEGERRNEEWRRTVDRRKGDPTCSGFQMEIARRNSRWRFAQLWSGTIYGRMRFEVGRQRAAGKLAETVAGANEASFCSFCHREVFVAQSIMASWSATSHEPLRSCGKGELADSGEDRRQRRRSNLFGLLLVAVGAFEVDLDRAARLPLHLR